MATTQFLMKKIIYIIGTSLFVSLLTFSCNNNSTNQQSKETTDEISKNQITDTIKEEKKEEVEKLIPANVTCKIYFLGDDYTDEETGEFFKGTVSERETFRTEKKYTFCYDSESFNNLTINGTGNMLTFSIKKNGKQIFTKENFELKNNLKFSTKDFDFEMAAQYSVEIKQNEKTIFSGKIDSQGCM